MSKKTICLALIAVLTLCLCLTACRDNPTDKPPVDDDTPAYWGKLSGTVTENDKPIQGVKVSAGSKSAVTDAKGKYEIEVYDDGAKVSFTKNGYLTQTVTLKSSSFNSGEYTYDFNIFRAVKVTGKVVDENDSAVENAVVTIGLSSVVSDADGNFVIDDVIGTSMMVFAEKDKLKAKKPIFTEEMQSGTVEIELVLR